MYLCTKNSFRRTFVTLGAAQGRELNEGLLSVIHYELP